MADQEPLSDLGTLIYCLSTWSLLPELWTFLNDDKKFLEFLDTFGGLKFVVPSRHEVATHIRNVHIYKTYQEAPQGRKEKVLDELSLQYEMSKEHVRKTWAYIRGILKKHGKVRDD